MKSIRKKELEFLTDELEMWQSENLITSVQAENILNLYELKKKPMRLIFLIAGLVLLFLGCASFAAAHWKELNQNYRLAIVSGSYILSVTAYYFFGASSSRAGRAFLLFGSFIIGAGIYFIPAKMKIITGAGWWVIAMFIITFLSRDAWELYLLECLAFLYMAGTNAINLIALQFMSNTAGIIEPSLFFQPVKAFLIIAGIWSAIFLTQDRAGFNIGFILSLTLISSRMILCFGSTITLIALVIFGVIISFISRWYDMMMFGIILSGIFGILLTWPEFWNTEIFSQGYFNYSAVDFYPLASAVIIALIMLIQIYRGNIIAGGIFFVLLAGRYFFDHLFGYLPKAWGFGAAGVIFLLAGIFLPKSKINAEDQE